MAAGEHACARGRPDRRAELRRGVVHALDAGGFDRHTFLCGQSGSGKTYALGVLLEQLLLATTLRIVVLDPNSDFARITTLRPAVAAEVDHAPRRDARRASRTAPPGAEIVCACALRELDQHGAGGASLRLDPSATATSTRSFATLLAADTCEPNAL